MVETGDRIGRLVLRPVAGDHPAAGNIPEQAVPIPGTLPAGHARHRGSYPHGHAGHIAAVRKPWLTLGYDEVRYLIITYTICLLIGSIVLMINKERRHEKEIEMLRIENLSSQYNAIANQISPTSFSTH